MIGDGTYNVPKGTWSDDTSMTLATMDSMIDTGKIDTDDMANKFLDWFRNNKYTATGETFDIGRTTLQSIAKFELGIEKAKKCGQAGEMDNGNGSLMRMLPIAYYIASQKNKNMEINEKMIYNIVKNVSSITHAHEVSILACYIYVNYVIELLKGNSKEKAYKHIKELDYSRFDNTNIIKFDKILKNDISKYKSFEIRSSGYVVDTLEAVFWLFLNSMDYTTTIIKAVNLGDDTDTVAAITGGLLGIYYGSEKINDKWKKDLKKLDYIEKLCDKFCDRFY